MSNILLRLDDDRSEWLENLAQSEKTTKTALIKDALDLLFRLKNKTTKNIGLDSYFGAWDHKEEDGLIMQHQLRGEWDR